MDGLSAAVNVIAVVQISEQVFNLSQTYYLDVRDARKDIQHLLNEVTSLRDVLINVKDLTDTPGLTKLSTLELLNKNDGLLQQCLADLTKLVKKLEQGQEEGKMKQFGIRALKWPFRKKEVDKAITVIERCKTMFALALNTDQTILTLELKEQVTAHQTDEYRDKVVQWLSTTDPSSNHHAACKKHQPTTGKWLLRQAQFTEWKMERNSFLWLYGKPGCGKTILSSTIIEHLKEFYDTELRVAVAYFYFDFSNPEKQNATNFLSSLISQLCRQIVNIPEKLKELYKSCNAGKHTAAIQDLNAVLAHFAIIEDIDDVFIVTDALDECPNNGEEELRGELLKLIIEIKAWSKSKIHFLITSRPESDIQTALTPLLATEAIHIQGSYVDSDIKLYISSQLSTDPKLMKWPSEVKEQIEKTLTAGADGMFRWVFCQLDALKKCKTRATLLNALKTLPRTLGDTYARILKNIDEEYQQHAQRALLWLAFSGRPLRIEEVAEAAVVDPRLSPPFNPEERLIDPRINILEILGSLVTISSMSVSRKVSGDNLPIEELSLAHFSVREYLTSERIQCSEASRFGTTDVGAHTFIAESCLQYIFHYDESDFKATSTKDLEDFPLLRYTCEFWYTHVKLIPLGSQKPIELVILKLFLSSTVLLSWLRIHCPTQPWLKPFEDSDAIGTALYHASNIGLQAVVQALLEEEANVNAKAEYGFTALHKAAYNGHEAVVQLLLEYEADIDAKPDNDYTALHQAAIKGHKAVLQLLLEHKADVNAKNNYDGETALYTAAYKGHEAVVQLLLEHKADVDAKASDGETALHKAAYNGHEAVVQLLLEHKAEVDAKANNGETALHAAAYNGHEAVVQLLLEHKVNVNAKSKYGFTALHHAAYNGHKEVVQLLLEYKADVDVKDNYNGETALHKAAMYGHEAVVRLLLKHKADVDAKSEYGFTALHQAAYNGRKEVVQLLLEYNADVYVKNNYDGEMALHYAAMNGHEAVVQLLKSKTPHKL